MKSFNIAVFDNYIKDKIIKLMLLFLLFLFKIMAQDWLKEIEKANSQLSKVKLEVRGKSLSVRGMFPENGRKVRKYISLGCKLTAEGVKVAIAKAKEIDAKLLLDKWESEIKDKKITVAEAIARYTANHWKKTERTVDREKVWQKTKTPVFNYLPEDEIFDAELLRRVFESFPPESHAQKNAVHILRPVANLLGIEFDYSPYLKYKQDLFDFRKLPKEEEIVRLWEKERYLPHKWMLGILAIFGLRPHEFYRSEFDLESNPPLVYVGKRTKTKQRTVYPIPIEGIDLLAVPNQWETIKSKVNFDRSNVILGEYVNKIFKSKYPFNPYALRHYYAARGCIYGLSPVAVAKWMGHSLAIHYKYYGRLLDDAEFQRIWREKFDK